MSEIRILTEFQRDAIKEVGNIGIGHATTSLSRMINKQVWLSLPESRLVPLTEIPVLVHKKVPVVGIVLEMKTDAKGFFLLLLSKPSAKYLIKLVIGESDENKEFDEMEDSVLKELGNIMSGTYITALSNFLGISIGLSTPYNVYDISEAIVNQIVGTMSLDVDNVLFLRTEFSINSEKIDGDIIIFTDSVSLAKILDVITMMAENKK